MDAETRHQLKQNELGEAIKRVSHLNDPWVGYSLIAVILFMAGWFGYQYLQERQEQQLAGAWRTVLESNPADPTNGAAATAQLAALASDGPNANVEAAARLRLGIAKRMAGRAGDPDALRAAAEDLSALGGDTSVAAPLRAAAWYAAALAQEDLREIGAARTLFEKLRDDTSLKGSPYHEMAKDRLATLGELEDPVTFEPGLRPIDLDAMLNDADSGTGAAPAPASAAEALTTTPAGTTETPADPADDPAAEPAPPADPGDDPAASEEPDPAATPEPEPTEP